MIVAYVICDGCEKKASATEKGELVPLAFTGSQATTDAARAVRQLGWSAKNRRVGTTQYFCPACVKKKARS